MFKAFLLRRDQDWWLKNFPGGSAAKTLSSQCRGLGFALWSENQILHAATKTWHSQIKKKKILVVEAEAIWWGEGTKIDHIRTLNPVKKAA